MARSKKYIYFINKYVLQNIIKFINHLSYIHHETINVFSELQSTN